MYNKWAKSNITVKWLAMTRMARKQLTKNTCIINEQSQNNCMILIWMISIFKLCLFDRSVAVNYQQSAWLIIDYRSIYFVALFHHIIRANMFFIAMVLLCTHIFIIRTFMPDLFPTTQKCRQHL